jgi:hypothetical protein
MDSSPSASVSLLTGSSVNRGVTSELYSRFEQLRKRNVAPTKKEMLAWQEFVEKGKMVSFLEIFFQFCDDSYLTSNVINAQ